MLKQIPSLLVYALIVAVALFGLVIFLQARFGSGTDAKFKAKSFLTLNEMEFLERLESAAPELRFHAQVSMGALLQPAVDRKKDNRAFYRARGMFSQKIVDFVAQRKSDGSIVAVIELDDRTHDPAKDSKRDAMLTQAGYRTVRWQSKSKPEVMAIRKALLEEETIGSKVVA